MTTERKTCPMCGEFYTTEVGWDPGTCQSCALQPHEKTSTYAMRMVIVLAKRVAALEERLERMREANDLYTGN